MNKELKALEKLNHTICFNINEKTLKFSLDKYDNCDCKDINDFANCYKTIEKELKAFAIIKNKKVNVEWLLETENVEEYNESLYDNLTAEEYCLLKEELLCEHY